MKCQKGTVGNGREGEGKREGWREESDGGYEEIDGDIYIVCIYRLHIYTLSMYIVRRRQRLDIT